MAQEHGRNSGASRARKPQGAGGDRGPHQRSAKDATAAKARREKRAAKAKARQTGVPGPEVPQAHEPVLEVRAFSSVDFSQLVRIMPPEWLFAGMSEAEEEAQAQMDLAGALAASNIALVATIDDGTNYDPVTAGLLLGRAGDLPPVAGADLWAQNCDEAAKVLRCGCPQARRAHTYVTQLEARGQLLLDAAGDARGPNNELVLFVVDPQLRGQDAGSALVDAFEQRLRELGEAGYWLQTDSSCAWQWYENHGFIRCAEVELGSEFCFPPGNPAINDLLDPAKAEACDTGKRPHALLYRKDL